LLRIPLSARILSKELAGETVIVTTEKASAEKIESLVKRGAQVWVTEADSEGRIDLPALWNKMGERGVTSVLIEGGSHIYTAALQANLVDKIAVFIAPKILGSGISAIQELGINHLQDGLQLFDLQTKQLGGDLLLLGYLHKRTH
ncbi:MAG: RibD family protein, partial [bacterium]